MEKPLKTDRVIGADRIRPISETPQIELKLTPRVGHHTSSPPLEAFGVTTNGLAYRGQHNGGGLYFEMGGKIVVKTEWCQNHSERCEAPP